MVKRTDNVISAKLETTMKRCSIYFLNVFCEIKAIKEIEAISNSSGLTANVEISESYIMLELYREETILACITPTFIYLFTDL